MGPRYHIEDGVFTTCHCGGIETPSWSLGGKTTDVELNGIGWVHGATFRVMDVPVLWFPILSFPALIRPGDGLPDAPVRILRAARLPVRAAVLLEHQQEPGCDRRGRRGDGRPDRPPRRVSLHAVRRSARQLRRRLLEREHPHLEGGRDRQQLRAAAGQSLAGAGKREAAALERRRHVLRRVRRQRRYPAARDPELQLDSRHRAAPGERAPHQDASRRDRHLERRPHAGGVGLLPGPDRSPGARPAARPVPPSRGLPSAARQSSGGPARGAGHGLPARRGIRRLPRRRLAEALPAVPGRLRAHGVGQRPAARDDVRPR